MATVTVTAVPATGFYRCGMKFTHDPKTLVEGKDVTSEQLAILKKEKMLVVRETSGESGDKGDGKLNAKEMIAKVMTVTDVTELKALKKEETRSTVLEAIEAQLEALKNK